MLFLLPCRSGPVTARILPRRAWSWSLRFVDNARAALHHLVELRKAVQRLRCAEKQIPPGLQRGVNTLEDVLLYVRGKIDQPVPAEHHVELAEHGVAI